MKRLSATQYAAVLHRVYHDAELAQRPVVVTAFVRWLQRSRALSLTPRIIAAIQRLEDRAAGQTRVKITSAREIKPESLNQQLASILGPVIIEAKTDTSLLGGLRLQIADAIIDSTIATRLNRLQTHLSSQ